MMKMRCRDTSTHTKARFGDGIGIANAGASFVSLDLIRADWNCDIQSHGD